MKPIATKDKLPAKCIEDGSEEVVLDVPDEYSFGSEVLEKELLRQYLLT